MRACPRCDGEKAYQASRSRLRCASCGCDFSETSGTARHSPKKPAAWYDQVAAMHRSGLSVNAIAKTGIGSWKAIDCFLKRLKLENREPVHD